MCQGRLPFSIDCKSLKKTIVSALKLPATLPGVRFAHNLVERRSLLFQLVRRDFEQRFVGSVAGWVWGVIHPLVLLLSWTFVFSVCLRVQVTDNYPLYLFAGMLPWLLFSETVQRSASSLLDQANLITKTVFPAEIVPVSIFLSSLASHVMALGLMIVVALFWLRQMSPALLLLPAYMALLGCFAVGLGWIVGALQVYVRDTAQMLSVVLTFWFWLTPIFITEDRFPPQFRFLLVANPLAYLVRAYRQVLLSSRLPSGGDFAILALAAVLTLIFGGLLFRYLKRGFADVL